ncbi:MAG: RNA polymerase sigma factor RpoD/SigA [Pedobacter sp.]|uniref:sigma-70 family RNA polymerase sigma factor n=1 Tax=Pedobacter sp. TaxID=1411316 RepID=UPI0033933A4C
MRELKLLPSITERDADSISRYLAEIARIPLLSVEEEVGLAKKVKEGDQAALERLVNANLRFVVSVAKNYQHRGLGLGDLINEGNLGLIKAATRFDHTKGFKFISFAVWWIRQTIILAIADQTRVIRLPLNLVNSISAINKTSSILEQQLERLPTQEEIAAEINLTDLKVKDYLHRADKHIYLETTLNSDTQTTVLHTIADHYASPDLQFNYSDKVYEVQRMLSMLSAREGMIIRLHYGLSGMTPMSLDDIASQFNLSKERIRQLRDGGIKKLRLKINRRTD